MVVRIFDRGPNVRVVEKETTAFINNKAAAEHDPTAPVVSE